MELRDILLIDPDVVSSFLSKKTIEDLQIGKEVHLFRNGREALQKIIATSSYTKKFYPDLIFFENNMPLMNGKEFLIELQKLNFESKSGLKTILLTSSLKSVDIESYYQLGVFDFICKPLMKESLIEIFRRYYSLATSSNF